MKKFVAGILALSLALGMTACGGNGDGGNGGVGGIVDRINKMLSSQGKEYDELITGEVGEPLKNRFFSYTVNDVKAADQLDGYTPQTEGNKFIVADITVKNVSDEEQPVGNYDFSIIWDSEEELSDDECAAYVEFMEGMYPDDVMLAVDKTLGGTLVFEIPEDVNEFGVVYNEIFDDESKGNSYVVECKL